MRKIYLWFIIIIFGLMVHYIFITPPEVLTGRLLPDTAIGLPWPVFMVLDGLFVLWLENNSDSD